MGRDMALATVHDVIIVTTSGVSFRSFHFSAYVQREGNGDWFPTPSQPRAQCIPRLLYLKFRLIFLTLGRSLPCSVKYMGKCGWTGDLINVEIHNLCVSSERMARSTGGTADIPPMFTGVLPFPGVL